MAALNVHESCEAVWAEKKWATFRCERKLQICAVIGLGSRYL